LSPGISIVTEVNRGSTFAVRRSTLDVCLGGQRSSVCSIKILHGSREAKGIDENACQILMEFWPSFGSENHETMVKGGGSTM